MTIDEALEMARQTKECWIVFNRETGEVLSVVVNHPDETHQDTFAHLATLSRFSQPVMARLFTSTEVTRKVLEKEQSDLERVRTRVRVLTEWTGTPTEKLLRMLERGQYDYPMHGDFDSTIIVDLLWELRRDELTLPARERLTMLLSSNVLGKAARDKLRIYLAALSGDEKQLKAIWTGVEPGRDCWSDSFALMDTLTHVATEDPEIIGDMIAILDMDEPFGCKFHTMIALGKIGPIAGPRAAATIRRAVHDSEPWIIAARDRVLERLDSAEDAWTICGGCCYGRVSDAEKFGALACPACLGLGFRHL